eukprot:262284-Pleurochrysis_carterae.AAC.7
MAGLASEKLVRVALNFAYIWVTSTVASRWQCPSGPTRMLHSSAIKSNFSLAPVGWPAVPSRGGRLVIWVFPNLDGLVGVSGFEAS